MVISLPEKKENFGMEMFIGFYIYICKIFFFLIIFFFKFNFFLNLKIGTILNFSEFFFRYSTDRFYLPGKLRTLVLSIGTAHPILVFAQGLYA